MSLAVVKHKSVDKYANIIYLTYYYMCYDIVSDFALNTDAAKVRERESTWD